MLSLSSETRIIRVDNVNIRVYSSVPITSDATRPIVVFFHGFSFSIDDWQIIGMLKAVEDVGYRVIAIDLPAGRASKSDKIDMKDISDCNPILDQVLSNLGVAKDNKLVLIGPSMGGGFALAYASENQERMSGLVLIAPAIQRISGKKTLRDNLPVLIIWGENDDVFPLDTSSKAVQRLLPKSDLIVLKGAGHPAYLDRPQEFKKTLLNFLGKISDAN